MVPSLIIQLKTLLLSLAALAASITPIPQQSIPNGPNAAVSPGTSRNWAGYTAANGNFTGVSGTWTIPMAAGNGHTSADATWVGIGGINSNDLIQSGTQNITDPGGRVTTSAFYELLPNVSQTIPVAVKTGDSVTVAITQQSTGQWLIAFTDNSTGQNYRTNASYNSSVSSAEWIVEAPSNIRRVLPLDSFGTVQFTDGSAIQNGNRVTISQTNAQAITMTNTMGQPLASPSSLGSDGGSFSVTRTSAVSNTPIPEFDRNPGRWRRQGFGIGGYSTLPARRRVYQFVAPSASPAGTRTITPDTDDSEASSGQYRKRGLNERSFHFFIRQQ